MKWIFVAAFLLSGIYHGVGLVNPALTEPATPMRHVVFLVINLIGAGILVKAKGRGLYLLFPLILQQIWSHAEYGRQVWVEQQRLDWASLIVVVGMPVLGVWIVKVNQKRLAGERQKAL